MAININAIEQMMPEAVRHFWAERHHAVSAQKNRGINDRGNRAGVTAGKNMNGFIALVRKLILDNGINDADIYSDHRLNMTIPGYYRPTKIWDLLITQESRLLAVIEFKSQVGPSFGNNFNNRVEESLGNAVDFLTAYREGAFGESSRPFLGYFFVLEECVESTRPVQFQSPHFKVFEDFENTSYAQRYEILCRKLVHECLYDSAALVLTASTDVQTGGYRSMSDLTSVNRFCAMLAGRISAVSGV